MSLADYVNFEIRNFKYNQGVFSEEIGHVKIHEKSWHLVTYIDLQHLDENIASARELFYEYKELCTTTGYTDYLTRGEHLILKKKFSEIESQKLELYAMLESQDNNNYKNRVKRALGPLKYVGTALKFVFGTLNENDKVYFDKQIEKLNNVSDDTLSLLGNQTQIVKSEFLVCKSSMIHIRNELSKTKELTNTAINNVEKIMIYTAVLNRYVSDLQIDCDALTNAIIFAKEGELHPKLINHKNIENVVNLIKLTENEYNLPVFSESPTLSEISKTSKIIILYSKLRLNYIIDIPLLEKNSYSLFKHHPLPKQIQDSSFFTYIFPSYEYTVINSDRDKYFNMNEKNLEQCIKFKETFICETQPLFKIN